MTSDITPASGRGPNTRSRISRRGWTIDGVVHAFATEPTGGQIAVAACGRRIYVHTVWQTGLWSTLVRSGPATCMRCSQVERGTR